MPDAVTKLTAELILSVLRDAVDPVDLATVRQAVTRRHGARIPRPTIDAALKRLAERGMVGSVDDPGHPRRWLAAPAEVTEGIDWAN